MKIKWQALGLSVMSFLIGSFLYERSAHAVDNAYAAACRNAADFLSGPGWPGLSKLEKDRRSFRILFGDFLLTEQSDQWRENRHEVTGLLNDYDNALNEFNAKPDALVGQRLRAIEGHIHDIYSTPIAEAIAERCHINRLIKKDQYENCNWSAEIHFESVKTTVPGAAKYYGNPKIVLCSLTDAAPHAPIGCVSRSILYGNLEEGDKGLLASVNHSRKASAANIMSLNNTLDWGKQWRDWDNTMKMDAEFRSGPVIKDQRAYWIAKNAWLPMTDSDSSLKADSEILVTDASEEALVVQTPQNNSMLRFGSEYPNADLNTIRNAYQAACGDTPAKRTAANDEDRALLAPKHIEPGAVALLDVEAQKQAQGRD